MLPGMRNVIFTLLLVLAACNSSIYTKDGVTDGDTFYLAPRAWADDDPVLQSWVAYSLARSACQLEVGGDNPARIRDADGTIREEGLAALDLVVAEAAGAGVRLLLLLTNNWGDYGLSLIHISEPTRPFTLSRMPSSA